MTHAGSFKIGRDRWLALIAAQMAAVFLALTLFAVTLEAFLIENEVLDFGVAGLATLAVITFLAALFRREKTFRTAFGTAAIVILTFVFSTPLSFGDDPVISAASFTTVALMSVVLLILTFRQPYWLIRVLLLTEAAIVFLGLRLLLNLAAD